MSKKMLIISATRKGFQLSEALNATASLSIDLGNSPKFLIMGGYRYDSGELASELSIGIELGHCEPVPEELCEQYSQESFLIVDSNKAWLYKKPENDRCWQGTLLGDWQQVETIDDAPDGWSIMPDGTIWTAK